MERASARIRFHAIVINGQLHPEYRPAAEVCMSSLMS